MLISAPSAAWTGRPPWPGASGSVLPSPSRQGSGTPAPAQGGSSPGSGAPQGQRGEEFDAAGRKRLGRGDLEERLAQLQAEKGAKEREKLGAAASRSAQEEAVLSQLKARDGEVRAHEAAHIAAGGRYITGGASYSYQRGPDGLDYAVGGEVGIDSSPLPGKPEETLAKMQVVRAAALAPADPSGADLSVAGAAAQAMAQAIAEIAEARTQATRGTEGAAAEGGGAASAAGEGGRGQVGEAGADREAGVGQTWDGGRRSPPRDVSEGPGAGSAPFATRVVQAPEGADGLRARQGLLSYRLASEPEALPGARIDLVA